VLDLSLGPIFRAQEWLLAVMVSESYIDWALLVTKLTRPAMVSSIMHEEPREPNVMIL
jgi:hypothetical protein